MRVVLFCVSLVLGSLFLASGAVLLVWAYFHYHLPADQNPVWLVARVIPDPNSIVWAELYASVVGLLLCILGCYFWRGLIPMWNTDSLELKPGKPQPRVRHDTYREFLADTGDFEPYPD
jgi:hypothetical protein